MKDHSENSHSNEKKAANASSFEIVFRRSYSILWVSGMEEMWKERLLFDPRTGGISESVSRMRIS
jgi:hypothetical protein